MLWEIELMNNRKVLVTDMETDLDVMNGIIIFYSDELPIGNKPIVWLKYLPAYILVKLTCTRVSRGSGCHPCKGCKYIKIRCTVHH